MTVLRLTRDLQVERLRSADDVGGAVRHVRLAWHEASPVTDRVVRLWPLWRLWDPPREYPVPDGARDGVAFSAPRALLPPGAYRVEVAVVDPWAPASPVLPPAAGSPHCADVDLGDPEERASYLAELPDRPLTTLERFLGTGDAGHLERPAAELDDEDAHTLVRAAFAMADVDDADILADETNLARAMGYIRSSLRRRPASLAVLAELAAFGRSTDHRLARLIVDLGYLRLPPRQLADDALSASRRRSLWHLWPPLLPVLDGAALVAGEPERVDAVRMLLGAHVGRLFGADDPAARRAARGELIAAAMRDRFDGVMVGDGLDRLCGVRSGLALVPSGVLDGDSWISANFDWLIRVKGDADLEARALAWIACCLEPAHRDLAAFGGRVGEITRIIERRAPTADHGPLRYLPILIGATALAERGIARGVADRSALLACAARNGMSAPLEAFAAAPALYARDLCLVDVLLLTRPPGAPA